MRPFKVLFTGDCLDELGNIRAKGLDLDALNSHGFIQAGFIADQAPTPGDHSYWDRLYSLEITADHIADADAIAVVRPWLKAEAFAKGAARLVAIARVGAGYDKIDIASCTANNVVVFNVPDSLTHSTASAAFTLMLALAKQLARQQAIVKSGRWDQQSDCYGDDLIGKTLGIVGLGRTGLELARLVAPFYMKVLAYSPRAGHLSVEASGIALLENLDDVLAQADFISLHCRLEKHTHKLIDAKKLQLMKPAAYFINVARGELVDESALIEALQDHRIAGAGLDVFETEPLPVTSPLLNLDNVILTPHWLPSTHRAARATSEAIVQNLLRVATGQEPQNVLNPEVLGRPEFLHKLAQFKENRHDG